MVLFAEQIVQEIFFCRFVCNLACHWISRLSLEVGPRLKRPPYGPLISVLISIARAYAGRVASGSADGRTTAPPAVPTAKPSDLGAQPPAARRDLRALCTRCWSPMCAEVMSALRARTKWDRASVAMVGVPAEDTTCSCNRMEPEDGHRHSENTSPANVRCRRWWPR